MVGVIRRLNQLTALVRIRNGPGAAVLPQDVTRIHMEFAHKINGGHMGPRKFWRDALPRLKYWNPAVPMVVNRSNNQEGPAMLTLYFREPGSAFTSDIPQPSSSTEGFAKAPVPAPGERVLTIDMKNRRSEAILKEFMDKSGAVAVKMTPQDEAKLREVEDLEATGAIDREKVAKMNAAAKREKQMIAQAHSEAAAIKAAL
ncbi:CI-B8 domain-containing protein [Parachaetomium inaequale]|uniref:CI-B8 domain-containing protein n=1 Tax=Parachaetomium inaequale TaxID=2588326 RepID=A0AAN6SR02_9PEZI|nr:CI-B8 domain-containing protein [Parachaetomium inaequale]